MLMADQLVLADDAAGVAADRVGRVVGRIGLWMLAATVASALVTCGLVASSGPSRIVVTLRRRVDRRHRHVRCRHSRRCEEAVEDRVLRHGAAGRARVPGARVHRQRAALSRPRAGDAAAVFWIGFNVAMLSLVVGRRPPALTTVAPTRPWLIAAQLRRADRAPDRATCIGVSAHGADTRLHLAGNGPTLDGGGFRRTRTPLRFMMAPSRPRRHSMTTKFKTSP